MRGDGAAGLKKQILSSRWGCKSNFLAVVRTLGLQKQFPSSNR